MSLVGDLNLAFRTLRKNPAFATVAILTLALGIGANTAIFSVISAVLISPLRYPDPNRIVALNTYWKQTGKQIPRLTGGDLVDIRDDGQIFEAISCQIGGEMGVQLRDRAEFTGTYLVNPDFFRVFGAKPVYGRLFEENDRGQAAAVSGSFAVRNFGSAARALGQTLRFENRSYQIAGVLPAGFQYPAKAEVWVPAPYTPENRNRTAYNYRTVAKLRPGTTLAGANTHLDTIATRLAAAYPDSNRNKSFKAIPLRDQLVGPVRSTLFLLMGAVALVLLIACTNVADLMIARATARSREMAVRSALGARRWDVVRPLLVESVVLSLAGGALGLLLAKLGTRAFLRVPPDSLALPRWNEIQIDWQVLAFVTGVSLVASLIFGLAPAWHALRIDLQDALKQGGSRGLVGGRSTRLRNGLVVAQIGLTFVLAIGAGLLLRSFAALTSVELGYRTNGILVMYAHAPAETLAEHVAVGTSFEDLFAQLSEIPGVTSVAGAMGLPTGQYGSNGGYAVEGKHVFGAGQKLPNAIFSLASPGYFPAMGIPLERGRDFSVRDQYNSMPVAIISAALARESFPDEDPIGRRIQCGVDSVGVWMTVVGVAGDVRQESPASAPEPALYMPLTQHPFFANEIEVVIRTALEPGSLISAVQQRTRAFNPAIATKFITMDAMVADSIAKPRLRMILISSFAGLALVLAMVGIYGVMNYLITERTSEFGVRVAMGAVPRDIVSLVLRRSLRLAAVGLMIGLALALSFSRVMTNMLFGLTSTDVPTYAAVAVAMTLVAILAAAIPAWRATRIDPLTALREE